MTKYLPKPLTCTNCYNVSRFEEVKELYYPGDKSDIEVQYRGSYPEFGTYYYVARCPKCRTNIVAKAFWNDNEPEQILPVIVHFDKVATGQKMPSDVLTAHYAANAVKWIDSGAYVTLARRLVEIICNKEAKNGSGLTGKLKVLTSTNGFDPDVRQFIIDGKEIMNDGAHASKSIDSKQVHLISEAIDRFLFEVYTIPALKAQMAEERVKVKMPIPKPATKKKK